MQQSGISEKYVIDNSLMPIQLGSAIRVPSYSYPEWGIDDDPHLLKQASENEYEKEWGGGSQVQIQYLSQSASRAGNPDFLGILRKACAETVASIASQISGNLNIMDVGAGLSTIAIYQHLDQREKNRTHLFLVEPSKKRLEETSEKLNSIGLHEQKNFTPITDKDLNIPKYIKPDSIDIITSVATVHHHSFLSFDVFYEALKPGGFFILADLHNHLYEHPARIYKFLESLEWPMKDKALRAFVKKFPKSLESLSYIDDMDKNADEMIMKNRRELVKIRMEAINSGNFDYGNDICLIEAHRPVGRYIEELIKSGFSLDTDIMDSNPRRLLPDANLLMLTIGVKPV